jgi:hypothetical protein
VKKLLKRTFVPHKENNYEPHIIREGVVIVFIIVVLAVLAAGMMHRLALYTNHNLAAVYAKALVALTNEERTESELGTLTVNPLLVEAARLKAEDMADKSYFAHYGPDGTAPWNWIEKAGYEYSVAGENLAIDFTDSDAVTEAWMNSPTHRANMLNSSFTEIGIATAEGEYKGHKTVFVVQMFGKPKVKAPTPAFAIAPIAEAEVKPVTKPAATTTTTPAKAPAKAVVARNSATSTNTAVATTASPVLGVETQAINQQDYIVTNPTQSAMILYTVLFGIFSIALICLIIFEFHKQDKKHVLYAISLLMLLVVAMGVYKFYIAGQVTISDKATTTIR